MTTFCNADIYVGDKKIETTNINIDGRSFETNELIAETWMPLRKDHVVMFTTLHFKHVQIGDVGTMYYRSDEGEYNYKVRVKDIVNLSYGLRHFIVEYID